MNDGPWIATYSGKRVWLDKPDPDVIDIVDIAHALSHICRWTGHVARFVSVAEHSVRCSDAAPTNDVALAALLHDASEAYLGDVSHPLKKLLPDYQRIEFMWENAIREKFKLNDHSAVIKCLDRSSLAQEARDLMCPDPTYLDLPPAFPENISFPWDPKRAKKEFLNRYHLLVN